MELARRVKNERLGLTQKKDRAASCMGRLRVCVGLFVTVTKKISQGRSIYFGSQIQRSHCIMVRRAWPSRVAVIRAGWGQRDEDSVGFASLLVIPSKSLTHEKVLPAFRVCLSPCFSQETSSQTHPEECFALRSKLIKLTVRTNWHRVRYGVGGWVWVLGFH